MSSLSNIISANYLDKMESPLKRQRAHDDLGEPPRKFSKFYPLQGNIPQSHLSPFTIHKSNSFHDDLVNGLPILADKQLSESGSLSPTTDKENIDPTTLDRHYNKTTRCLGRKPLQEKYPDIEGNVGTDNNDASISQECWVTRDGELYTTITGPLARSSVYEWETSKWMNSKDEDSAGENPQLIDSLMSL